MENLSYILEGNSGFCKYNLDDLFYLTEECSYKKHEKIFQDRPNLIFGKIYRIKLNQFTLIDSQHGVIIKFIVPKEESDKLYLSIIQYNYNVHIPADTALENIIHNISKNKYSGWLPKSKVRVSPDKKYIELPACLFEQIGFDEQLAYKYLVTPIKLLREENGLRQEEMAEKIGISRSYYCEIETDKKKPSFAVLEQIKAAFPERLIDDLFFKKLF